MEVTIMFESFGSFTMVFALLTFIAVLGIIFQKQIDELEDRFDEYMTRRKQERVSHTPDKRAEALHRVPSSAGRSKTAARKNHRAA